MVWLHRVLVHTQLVPFVRHFAFNGRNCFKCGYLMLWWLQWMINNQILNLMCCWWRSNCAHGDICLIYICILFSGICAWRQDFIGMLASVASASSSGRPAAPETEQLQQLIFQPRLPQNVDALEPHGADIADQQPKSMPRRRKRYISVFEASRCNTGSYQRFFFFFSYECI